MLTKEQEPTEPWGDLIIGNSLLYGKLSMVFFVAAALIMFFVEAIAIHELWFKPNPSLSYTKRSIIPLYVFLPCFLGFALRVGIARFSKVGQISLPAAANLELSLSSLLVITYIAILLLTEIAFD